MTMNIELLRKIQRGILKEPKRYNQEIWGANVQLNKYRHPCNTAGCIAGWAYAIDEGLLGDISKLQEKYLKADGNIPALAQKVLGLSGEERHLLFHVENWPAIFRPFKVPYEEDLRGPRWLQAIVGAIRIEVFIRSKGNL